MKATPNQRDNQTNRTKQKENKYEIVEDNVDGGCCSLLDLVEGMWTIINS